MEVKCRIEVKDKNTVTVTEFPCNSFVRNMLAILRAGFVNASETVYNVNNSGYNVGSHPITVTAPEASAGYGIVVGTGTTPVSPTDYKLENQIPHGTGSGQLYYKAVSLPSLIVTESGVVQKIQREFENRSTADVTVNEIGIVVLTSVGQPVLVFRDVLSSSVTIPSGSTSFFEIQLITPP